MQKEKIILGISGLIVFLGVGFIAIKNDNKYIKQDNAKNPTEASQQPIEKPTSKIAGFNQVNTLNINDKIVFADGLNVVLKKINDSRCPKDVQCIWAGEITAIFSLSGGKLLAPQEISLGTQNNKSFNLNGYTFSLQNASTTIAALIVQYKKPGSNLGSCYVGGCSAQVCSDQKDIVSTCEYKESYACYKTAKCERQATGQCGWTQTKDLQACLSK